MTILTFLVVLVLLILVHEWGHFIVAKKTGMRVDEFGIGFPPKLFGIKKGETEYTLNALPIGGFVKIYGEDSEARADGEEDSQSTGRAFTDASYLAQALVLVAGVTMNIIFAWILFSLAFMIGVPSVVSTTEAGPEAALRITEVYPDTPAAEADIPVGAEVVGIVENNGSVSAKTPEAFSAYIKESEEPVPVRYIYKGEEVTRVVTPEKVSIGGVEEQVIGVSVALVEIERLWPHVALWEGLTLTITSLYAITVGILQFLFDALTLNADLSQVAGPVGIAGMVGDASAIGFTSLMFFAAFISLNLAIINLLPFPALDGGRLLFVGIEALTNKKIPPAVVGVTNAIGFGLLILLMLVVTYSDITKLF